MGQHKRNPLHSAYSFNHHLQHTSHNKGFQEIASGAKAPLLNTLYHKPKQYEKLFIRYFIYRFNSNVYYLVRF